MAKEMSTQIDSRFRNEILNKEKLAKHVDELIDFRNEISNKV